MQVPTKPETRATALEIDETTDGAAGALLPAGGVAAADMGTLLAELATEALSGAFGRTVRLASLTTEALGPDGVTTEQGEADLSFTISLEIDGATYPAGLLLLKARTPALLPAFSGIAELVEAETVTRLLQELAEHLTSKLAEASPLSVRLAVVGQGVPPLDGSEGYLRLEHTLISQPAEGAGASAGASDSGDAESTALEVVHLVSIAALQALSGAADAAVGERSPGTPLSGEPISSPSSLDDVPTAVGPRAEPEGVDAGRTPRERSSGPGRDGEAVLEAGVADSPRPAGTYTQGAYTQGGGAAAAPAGGPETGPQIARFQSLDGPSESTSASNLNLLLDVGLRVTVELGRTKLAIKDLLALGPGSVVELDTLAGEPVNILVNDRLIAKGEVVVVDENFGVRVTDIISPQRRLVKTR